VGLVVADTFDLASLLILDVELQNSSSIVELDGRWFLNDFCFNVETEPGFAGCLSILCFEHLVEIGGQLRNLFLHRIRFSSLALA